MNHKHTAIWIKELKSNGIYTGPNGQALEDLDYYELRRMVMMETYKREGGE